MRKERGHDNETFGGKIDFCEENTDLILIARQKIQKKFNVRWPSHPVPKATQSRFSTGESYTEKGSPRGPRSRRFETAEFMDPFHMA